MRFGMDLSERKPLLTELRIRPSIESAQGKSALLFCTLSGEIHFHSGCVASGIHDLWHSAVALGSEQVHRM